MNESDFWDWCIANGYHNEDYVLEHREVLETLFEEEQDEPGTI